MLLKSAVFRGHTLAECLQVIRRDIITVWNFNDPDEVCFPSLGTAYWSEPCLESIVVFDRRQHHRSFALHRQSRRHLQQTVKCVSGLGSTGPFLLFPFFFHSFR